ncbi:MAG: hypothetical protein LAT78_08285, partial [Roseinatronobacter sp.]|nr:hypothetical protein [Roseinatronobacter sp.]
RSTVLLRSFFGTALKSTVSEDGIAAECVRQRLRALIGNEPPEAPLNDAALARRLAGEGIEVARRTVAKYREAMGLGTARQRRARHSASRQIRL